jgi:Skp family chaperone for outer membrane proteins
MTYFKKTLAAALLSGAMLALPAQAQVSGIATMDSTGAIMQTKAFGAAYQQIGSTFASNAQLMQAKRKEMNDINAQLDANKDKTLTQEELDAAIKAKNPLIGQLEAKEKEIGQLQDPIIKAQAFAVESIADKFAQAQQQVVAQKKISIILSPDAFIWAPDAVDVTTAITAALDVIAPTVSTTPPANWQPKQSTGQLYEQVQQRIVANARYQAYQQAAAQQAAKPATGTAPKPAAGTPATAPRPTAAPAPRPQPDSR